MSNTTSLSILAIETCSEICPVALAYQGQSFQLISTEQRGHADNVLPMVKQLLDDARIELKSLDAIAFTRGPGAFTGVRIGTSVAQGLSVSSGLPLIAISSLAVLAQSSHRLTANQGCLAALDARMSEVYFGAYQANDNGLMVALQDDQVASPTELKFLDEQTLIGNGITWQAFGPGWNNYIEEMKQRFIDWNVVLPDELAFPEAIDLLDLAIDAYKQGDLLDPADALPIYIRDQVVRSSN
jgi:tRNA threonylcarbamoyladenosine biosynthesis protein TsaB